MLVRILGSSGSVGTQDNPASSYLIRGTGAGAAGADAASEERLVLDLGAGTFGRLRRHINPSQVHVVFSHLHADHCSDFPSLLVWRRFHPTLAATRRHMLAAPGYAPVHLGRLSSDNPPDGVDDFGDSFIFSALADRHPFTVAGLSITPHRVQHPVECYALRVEDPATGAIFTYSGDTAACPALVEAARGAHVFFCEATWGTSSEGRPAGMHMNAVEAAQIAQQAGVHKLVLVHIPEWEDPQACVDAARVHFDGPVEYGGVDGEYRVMP